MPAVTLWITGLPGSGKSALAQELAKARPEFIVLSMDEYRKLVTPEPTYSEEEREIAYRGLIYTAKKMTELGHDTIIDATGNRKRWRELARGLLPGFAEVYLKCPAEECMRRERTRTETRGAPRDIYLKGEQGRPVPGVTVPYEEPENPELVIETDRTTVAEAAAMVLELLRRRL